MLKGKEKIKRVNFRDCSILLWEKRRKKNYREAIREEKNTQMFPFIFSSDVPVIEQ